MLRAEEYRIRTLAHHGKSIGGSLSGGNCPGCATPTLILHVGNLPRPTSSRVEVSRQCYRIVNTLDRVHPVNLSPTDLGLNRIEWFARREQRNFLPIATDSKYLVEVAHPLSAFYPGTRNNCVLSNSTMDCSS